MTLQNQAVVGVEVFFALGLLLTLRWCHIPTYPGPHVRGSSEWVVSLSPSFLSQLGPHQRCLQTGPAVKQDLEVGRGP